VKRALRAKKVKGKGGQKKLIWWRHNLLFTGYYNVDQLKDSEICGTYNTHGRNLRYIKSIVRKCEGRDIGSDGRVKLCARLK
jgi:hypothetical protein